MLKKGVLTEFSNVLETRFDIYFVGFLNLAANQNVEIRTRSTTFPPTDKRGFWLARNGKTNLKTSEINQNLSRRGNGVTRVIANNYGYANEALREL